MLTNRSNDEAYGVSIEYKCSQSVSFNPLTWGGSCYGYASVQALGDQFLQIPENHGQQRIELPLTDEVISLQVGQIIPTFGVRSDKLYLFYSGLHDLIDELDNQTAENSKLILGCYGVAVGHAVGLQKQTDGKFVFFDCNKAKYIINSKQQLKDWLPGYFAINYFNYFYAFSADIVTTNEVSSFSNLLATCGLAFKKFISTPVGIAVIMHRILTAISKIEITYSTTDSTIDHKVPSYGSTFVAKKHFGNGESLTDEVRHEARIEATTESSNSNTFNGFMTAPKMQPEKKVAENTLYTKLAYHR